MYINPTSQHSRISLFFLGVIPFCLVLYAGAIIDHSILTLLFFIFVILILVTRQLIHVFIQCLIAFFTAYLIIFQEVSLEDFHIIDSTGFLLRTFFPYDYKSFDLYHYVSLLYGVLIPGEYIEQGDVFSLDIVASVVDINYLMLYFGVSTFLIFQKKILNCWFILIVIILIFLTPTGNKWALYAGKEIFLFLFLVLAVLLWDYIKRPANYILILALLFLLFVGTITRPYFIVFFISTLIMLDNKSSYILFFKTRLALISILFLFFTILLFNNPILYIKSLALNFLGVFSSPLPTFNNINLIPFEVLVNIFVLTLFFSKLIFNSFEILKNVFISIFYLSITMVLVVMYTNISQGTDHYGLYYSRTRFPFYVIFLLFLSIDHYRSFLQSSIGVKTYGGNIFKRSADSSTNPNTF